MTSPPLITVAICSHNRAAFVDKAVASLAAQTLAPRKFDVLIVDNASSDDTGAVVQRWVAADSRVRGVREDRLGLSHARNRAIAETSARYLAFLDDDAIASPRWLECLLEAFESVSPAPIAVGGPVTPIWGAPRPAWLVDGIRGCLTIVDWGDKPRSLDLSREYIAGANMAFERDALVAIGGFDVGLGRVGGRLLSGEEILVLRQLVRRGGIVHYDPRASVQHYVPPERLDKRWFYQRYYWEGISQAVGDVRLNGLSAVQRVRPALRSIYNLLRSRRWSGLFAADDGRRLRSRLETLRQASRIYGYLRFR